MTEVSLAWLLSKVTAPVVGATKLRHIEGAAKAVDLELTEAECAYLEEPYVPHPLAGVWPRTHRPRRRRAMCGPQEVRKFEEKIRRAAGPAVFRCAANLSGEHGQT